MNGIRFLKMVWFLLLALTLVVTRPLFLPIWFFSKPAPDGFWFAWYPMLLERGCEVRIVWLRAIRKETTLLGSSPETCTSLTEYLVDGEWWM